MTLMRLRRRIAVVVAAGALVSACSSPAGGDAAVSPATPSVSSRDVASLVDTFFAVDTTGYYRNLQAVLVSVDGDLVVEEYRGISVGDRVNVQSVGKSILSSLVGIAIDEGLIEGVDQTLADLLPDEAAEMPLASRRITLEQLLTMTAGLPDDPAFYSAVLGQPHWVRYILARLLTTPAGSFVYSSAGSHLISAILQRATGMTTLAYARARLFDPLGISTTPSVDALTDRAGRALYDTTNDFAWFVDPQGVFVGGGGQKITARDMLTLGRMWLDGGRWQGRQVVPAGWLTQATRRQVDSDYGSFGYGYQFWVTTADGHPAFAALGFGGQLIEVVPDLDLVVVVQSTSPTDPTALAEAGTAQEDAYLQMVDLILAPALR